MRDSQVLVGVLSGAVRKGHWIPPRHLWSVAVMGGVDLDFREARMGPGVCELSAFAFMGGVKIIVPPDLQVESGGIGIMGGFECSDEVRTGHDPDAPILRINGLAMMDGVEVKVREPGETALDAWRRRKAARRAATDHDLQRLPAWPTPQGVLAGRHRVPGSCTIRVLRARVLAPLRI